MKIFNSKTLQLESFESENPVTIYVCGPTVYDYAHIGNLRVPIVFDLFRTILKNVGYQPVLWSNFTDIDDKIIDRAKAEHTTWEEISTRYINAYTFDVFKFLSSPIRMMSVSMVMSRIISLIEELIKKDFAYVSDGNVLFDTSKITHHLFVHNHEKLIEGARVEVSSYKKNPADFILWKQSEEEFGWLSPFINGYGRPGWHIECSAMVDILTGLVTPESKTLTVHGGGVDLKFPHHENEESQSYAANGVELAKYWMHVGQLTVGGQKMSKSLNNTILIRELTEEKSLVRLVYFLTHYRQPMDWERNLELAKKKFDKWMSKTANAKLSSHSEITEFWNALYHDINTPKAVAVIDKYIKSKEFDKAKTAISVFLS